MVSNKRFFTSAVSYTYNEQLLGVLSNDVGLDNRLVSADPSSKGRALLPAPVPFERKCSKNACTIHTHLG